MTQPEFGKIYEQIKFEPKIEFLVFYRGQHYFFHADSAFAIEDSFTELS